MKRPNICLKVTPLLHKAFAAIQADAVKGSKFHAHFVRLDRDDRELLQYAPVGLLKQSPQPSLPIRFTYSLATYMEYIGKHKSEFAGHFLWEKSLKHILKGCEVVVEEKELVFKNPAQEARKQMLYNTAAEREYKRLVKDVDEEQVRTRKAVSATGSTVKNGMLAVHMMIGLFAGFFGGYLLARSVVREEKNRLIGGVIGLIFVFLLEMFLFLFNACKAEVRERDRVQRNRAAALAATAKKKKSN
mgnify:CR=1 FL=1